VKWKVQNSKLNYRIHSIHSSKFRTQLEVKSLCLMIAFNCGYRIVCCQTQTTTGNAWKKELNLLKTRISVAFVRFEANL